MHHTPTVAYRKEKLKKLLFAIQSMEDEIALALQSDLAKPVMEALLTETFVVQSELKLTISKLRGWASRKIVWPSLLNFPSFDYIRNEAYGNVLVISPWNYPFQLALCPVIAAFAAGNAVTLKPSEHAPHTNAVLLKLLSQVFDASEIAVVEGDSRTASELLSRRWDYIFFTGSAEVGRIVANAAAKFLTPVTLELGGKNPCIVANTSNLRLAARRIAWGKFLNAGQTCIAADYVIAQADISQQLLQYLKEEILAMYGEDPKASADFARIVNTAHWHRLSSMIDAHKVYSGGQTDEKTNYIAPTLISEDDPHSGLMQHEIFGPLLPVLEFRSEAQLDELVSAYEKPLALYVFSDDNEFCERVLAKHPSGGVCINDTVVHFANTRLPFGGVGNSGMGAYHGKYSFDTFSHKRSVSRKATWLDIPLRYPPYGNRAASIKNWLKWF